MGTNVNTQKRPSLPMQDLHELSKNGHMKNRIKDLRVARGLTQAELAELAGTTKNQLVKLEGGSRRLSDHWAQRLAPHLGVSPYELFMPADATPLRLVPIIGNISCGNWQEAIENAEGMVAASANGGRNLFALKAAGTSMDMLINDGGYVYVDPDDRDLIDGKVYAVMNGNNETTAKRYKANPARLVPCSSDQAHKEIIVGENPFTVIGRIVGTFSPL